MAQWTFAISLAGAGADEIKRNGGAIDTLRAAIDTAMGVLVADAASPTQGHVNTANAALTAYEAAQAISGDLRVTIDLANITTITKLKVALRALVQAARSSGMAE